MLISNVRVRRIDKGGDADVKVYTVNLSTWATIHGMKPCPVHTGEHIAYVTKRRDGWYVIAGAFRCGPVPTQKTAVKISVMANRDAMPVNPPLLTAELPSYPEA